MSKTARFSRSRAIADQSMLLLISECSSPVSIRVPAARYSTNEQERANQVSDTRACGALLNQRIRTRSTRFRPAACGPLLNQRSKASRRYSTEQTRKRRSAKAIALAPKLFVLLPYAPILCSPRRARAYCRRSCEELLEL